MGSAIGKPSFQTRIEQSVDIDLKPGDLFIAEKPAVIKTLLGSCVSVVMHNKRTGISTISHAQLPGENNCEKCSVNCPVKCYRDSPASNMNKYVTHSSYYMLKKLENMGVKRSEIDVKLFGGANVIKLAISKKTIGAANIEKAHETIRELGLKLRQEDTGGKQGRTIYLISHNGDVYVRKHIRVESSDSGN